MSREKEQRSAAANLLRNSDFRLILQEWLDATGAFSNFGMGPNPFTSNALNTAHETGKMAATQHLISIFSSVDPAFFPNLYKEFLNARAAEPRRPDDRDGD